MNERFFSLCIQKLKEKQKELGEITGGGKEDSPMRQALKEKGLIKEDDEKENVIYELFTIVNYAVRDLNCSFLEAWNGDYIDLYDAVIFNLRNGGDE